MERNDNSKTFKIVMCIVMVLITAATAILMYTDILKSSEDAEAATVYKQGSTGAKVKTIQTKLKNWGYYAGTIDGIYGSKTTAAVKYFQRVNKLSADGIVGKKTAAALGISLGSSSSTSSTGDSYLLARLIYGEARGEPYTGQVAIAAVALNRVRSSSFPNTISGVIYQPGAFTVVSDGQINLTPNDTAIRAAKDAMNGWDPTYGCLFYYNPNTATNAWIRSKTIKLTIGEHVFCV
ncbi:MAG TPA: spore cortex-lytic enzyme [Clostridia bacterium]|nr:spore cortex-lytic enzyme [Clostridia bacterium]